MSRGRRLVNAMLKAGEQKESEVVDMVIGKVLSVNPLNVKVGKLELNESFLIVGALCVETVIKTSEQGMTPYVLTVPGHATQSAGDHTHSVSTGGTAQSAGGHTHNVSPVEVSYTPPDLMLWRGLKAGDEVYMFKMAKGQKYYIMQRKEGITDAS